MKNMTRVLCLLLVLMLAVGLFACTTDTPNTSGADESAAESAPEESKEPEFVLFGNLPADKKYGGAPINILTVGDYANSYMSVEVMPHESSYELLQKNVKDRNDKVEEYFEVELQETRTSSGAEMMSLVRGNALAGVSEYEIVMPYMYDAATLAAEGYFFDLNTLENVHLDQKYYVQNSVSGLSIYNKNYFVSGDMCLLDFACTHALVFNKDMVEQRFEDSDNPYTLVENGKWTLDKMAEMAHGVTADDDGEPGMGCGDTYGFLINSNFATSMFMGCGFRITDKNAQDEPVIALGSESAAACYGKIYDLINDETACGHIDDSASSYYTTAMQKYPNCWQAATESVANQKALFRAVAIIDVFDLGEYDCNFGVLPTPKYDESQDNYLCRVSTAMSSCVAIPVNVEDPERAAIILDALMQSSTDTTKHAYFEVIMKERKIQDTESEKMLDIIFDGRVYDLCYLYDWGGSSGTLSAFMNSIVYSGANTYISSLDAIKSASETMIADTLATYKALT